MLKDGGIFIRIVMVGNSSKELASRTPDVSFILITRTAKFVHDVSLEQRRTFRF